MQNIKEVEVPIQKIVSDAPAGLSELLNLRHDGEDVTSLFSELGSKELFQTKGKCYGAIIHADKCYAIHKDDSGNATLVCYMNIDGEVKDVSYTSMSYDSNDLAQMFIVRNELLYLDGREYKQVELPQYTLNGQSNIITEQKEDFVGCDKIDVSISSGQGFAHPVKYFVRRRFSNGSVSQITGSSMPYYPIGENQSLDVGMTSQHGWKITIHSDFNGTVMLYRLYAGATSLLGSIDMQAGSFVEYNDESPENGQAIPDEGATDTPISSINGSAISFWNDRSIIASLSGENGESSISTNLDVNSFKEDERATISFHIKPRGKRLECKFLYGTFIAREKYSFVARVYFRNRVEVFSLGTATCPYSNSYCNISLKNDFADFLLNNEALRVDYGYSSFNTVRDIGVILPVHKIRTKDGVLVPSVPIDVIGDDGLFGQVDDYSQFIVADGDTPRTNGECSVDIYKAYKEDIVADRQWTGVTVINNIGDIEKDTLKRREDKGSIDSWGKRSPTDLSVKKGGIGGSIKDWRISFCSLRTINLEYNWNPDTVGAVADEHFCLAMKVFVRKQSLINNIGENRVGVIKRISSGYLIESNAKANSKLISSNNGVYPTEYVMHLKEDHNVNIDNEAIIIEFEDNNGNRKLISLPADGNTGNIGYKDVYPSYARNHDSFSFEFDEDEKRVKQKNFWSKRYTLVSGKFESQSSEKIIDDWPKDLYTQPSSVNIRITGNECVLIKGLILSDDVHIGYIRASGAYKNSHNISSTIYKITEEASIYCDDYYDCDNLFTSSMSSDYENTLTYKVIGNVPSKIPSIYRCDNAYRGLQPLSTGVYEMNPLYNEIISDSVFLDIESKSFVDKSINDIKIYWSLPTSNKTYKPWLSFYQESFKTLDKLGEVLKMFPLGNCLLCVCTDGLQAVFAPAHSMTGENGESIALTNAEFVPSVRTISRQPLTDNPDNVIFANDYVYILSEKQGELIGVSPNLEVKYIASTESCKLLVESIASGNKFRSNNEYSFLSYHYDKNELLICNQDRSITYGRFGFEMTSYYNTGVGVFVSGIQCIANDNDVMYKLRCDSSCKKILDRQEDVGVDITLSTPYNSGLVVDGLTLDTSYITHTLFDESTAKHRNYKMIAGRNDANQDNPWHDITVANGYSSTKLPLLERGDGRHVLYAASRFLENILRITIPRVKEIAENTMRLHGNRLYFKLHSKPKARIRLKTISMLIHAFKR